MGEAASVVDPTTIRTRAEFGAGLNALRAAAGFTVRELAKRIERPPGTLGDYLSGRHVPSPGQQSLIVDVLTACGVTDGSEVEAWLTALRRVRASSDRRTTRSTAPYRGLKPFEPEDAALFFGRREQTAEIVQRVAQLRREPGPSRGLLAVIGPSGSGKSSLLRAGVVAAVRAGALDDAGGDTDGERWTCAIGTPGNDPGSAFAAALAARGGGPHLVVIDQFEEIFTLTHDAESRSAFLDALATTGPDVVVVLGMRADFFAEAAREPVSLAALRHAQVVIGPLTSEQLRDVVVGPANQIGVAVEDGLVEVVLADLGAHHTGVLPLLSHALLATWDRSSGRRLTIADYRATGGLDAAVQRTAEEVFTALDIPRQGAAHDLFVRLVNVGDDVAFTRRRISRAELDLDAPENAERAGTVREVVDRFAERRLLTLTENSVEVSHEALLTAWPRLHGWLAADRAGLLIHRRITAGANAWLAADRDPAALTAGATLETALDWAAQFPNHWGLNAVEQSYLDASVRRRDELARAERRRTRRLVQLLVAVAVLALVASGLAIVASVARRSADHSQRAAAAARDDALSRQVAIQARELATSDPSLAQQLAVAGYRISATTEARSELLDAAAAPVITRVLGPAGPTPLAVSSRGTVAVGHADDGSVRLMSVPKGQKAALGTIPGSGQELFGLAFSPDGRLLATGGEPHDVTLWDVHDPRHPRLVSRVPTGFAGALQALAFAPDGHSLLAAGAGPHPLDEWDVSTPARPTALPAPHGLPSGSTVQAVAFDRTGSSVAAVTLGGDIVDWSTARPGAPKLTGRSSAGRLNAVAFAPTTGQLLTGGSGGGVTIWNTTDARLTVARVLPGNSDGQINVLTFSPDGSQLLSGSSDDSVRQWQVGSWTAQPATPGPGPVTGAAFSPDGASVLSTSADGALRRWSTRRSEAHVSAGTVFSLGFTGDGHTLAVAQNGVGGGVQLWDARNPRAMRRVGPLLTMTGGHGAIDGVSAISRDGRLVAAGNSTGQVELWDTRDVAEPRQVAAPFTASTALIESVALSPDGMLLAVGGDDHAVSLWSLRDPAHPARLSVVRAGNLVLDVAFSPDGRLLAAASADHTAHLWDVSDPRAPSATATLGGFDLYVYGVAFSPDGRMLAASSADRTTRLWSVRDPRRPVRIGAALRGPTDYENIPSFDASGRLLAVPSNDHTVWVYDVSAPAHARVLATLRSLHGNVFAAAFSPVGHVLVAGGRSVTVPVWSIDAAADTRMVCAGAGSPITRAEWRQYVPGARYDPPCP